MDVNEHETIQHYTQTQIKVMEQLVVRKDIDTNEHEKLSNTTLHPDIKNKRNIAVITVLYFTATVGSSIMSNITHTLK